MRIRFYAHASFRLETPELAVVTDPYTPGPEGSGFEPIDEAADIVIMSSSTDRFHSDASHVRGSPTVIDALLLPIEGRTVRGVPIRPFPATESQSYDYGRDPDDNAMYAFTLGDLRVLHMGDIGTKVPPEHLRALKGTVDVLLALTGGHATIGLDDLDDAIEAMDPRVIIPMHYHHPRGVLDIDPVDDFLARHPSEMITMVNGPNLELSLETLPPKPHIYVLEQAR